LLYGKALSENINKDPKVKRQLEQISKQVVISELLRREIEQKVQISDEDAKSYYQANKGQYAGQEKYRASHILVDTEEGAEDALNRLNAGEDFASLAKEKSKCPSKDKGGDLGLTSKGMMAPEFEDAALSLEPGGISNAVKTQFGYHIIRLEEKQPVTGRSFEEVKEQIKQTLLPLKQKETFDALIKELKDKNKVVVYKEALRPPAQQIPASPAGLPEPAMPVD
jgi:peptidyl-prolyl cis-trans isomerase C